MYVSYCIRLQGTLWAHNCSRSPRFQSRNHKNPTQCVHTWTFSGYRATR